MNGILLIDVSQTALSFWWRRTRVIILVVCGQNNERLKINDRMRIAFRVSWEGSLLLNYAVCSKGGGGTRDATGPQ